ncbi:MAG: hypothetical protein C5B53_10685 [Candidatus Melainabacteria bacterium]|nr:MAG: hypothetical protein C5B53_10685 [Candidatus Melainabacteria bacterium]
MANQEELNSSADAQLITNSQAAQADRTNLPAPKEMVDQGIVNAQAVIEGENGNCASMDLAIQSEALSVSLRSRASLNPETISLTAQVRLLADQLAQVTMKLDEANYKIGFLEGQMFAQREKFEELRARVSERQPSKRNVLAWLYERLPFNSSSRQ